MSITDRDIADLVVGLYGYPGYPPVAWTYLDPISDDAVYSALLRHDAADILIERGSDDPRDWINDGASQIARTLAAPYDALGPLPWGFSKDLPKMWSEARPMLRERAPLIIGGHSLGASRSSETAGMAVVDGIVAAAVVTWGQPFPGQRPLADTLARAGVVQRTYRNKGATGHDAVTDFPVPMEPLFPYVKPSAPIDVDAPPTGNIIATHGLFARHHATLYAGVTPATVIV